MRLELILKKKQQWHIAKKYQPIFLENGLSSFDEVYHNNRLKPEERVTYSPSCSVYKIHLNNKNYYLKRYNIATYDSKLKTILKRILNFLGQSKAKNEWENLIWFKKQGISAAKVVAYGRETTGWITKKGLLITAELVNAMDLVGIVEACSDRLEDKKWFAKISHQVATISRKLHQLHFTHNDLKWRNIMVDMDADFPQVSLIDCPSGKKWFWPFLQYRVIKDLACLDKRAKYHLSKSQRLAFYKDYAQCEKLTAKHKKQIHKILKFFHNRE